MNQPLKRVCGTCTACCFTHRVPELRKPLGTWCEECAIHTGCKIYENRPRSCQKYACAWLQGLGAETDRPDMSEAVLGIIENDVFSGKNVLEVLETVAGASKKPSLQALVHDHLKKGGNVFISLSGTEEGVYVLGGSNTLPRDKRRLLRKERVTTISLEEYLKTPA